MKSKFILISGKTSSSDFPAFIICVACFLAGCALAVFFVGYVSDAGVLSEYMSRYLTEIGGGKTSAGFLSAFLSTSKYHFVAVFFAFSIVGFIFIPLLSAARGFFFTFSIAVIIRLYGGSGILLALCLFGINALIVIPCYFVLAAMSFSVSRNLFALAVYPGQRVNVFPVKSRYFMVCLICFLILIVATVIDVYFTEKLVQLIATSII